MLTLCYPQYYILHWFSIIKQSLHNSVHNYLITRARCHKRDIREFRVYYKYTHTNAPFPLDFSLA